MKKFAKLSPPFLPNFKACGPDGNSNGNSSKL